MRRSEGRRRPRRWRLRLPLLPLVLGITDGILNSLTLAASAILLGDRGGITFLLALRVGTAALVTAAFTMFVADYSERRTVLVRGSRQLNMTEPGRLASSSLGGQALHAALGSMSVAGTASLIGATLPLLAGVLFPGFSWIVIALAIAALGVLGWILASIVHGNRVAWASAMALGGIIVTLIGLELRIA